jgi:hypothetical protein
VEHRGHRATTRGAHALDHGGDGIARLPDLVHDQHIAIGQLIRVREAQDHRLLVHRANVVVGDHRRHEDGPDPQLIGEHPGRHHAATRDDQHHVEAVADLRRQSTHERIELVPAHVDPAIRARFDGGLGHHPDCTAHRHHAHAGIATLGR